MLVLDGRGHVLGRLASLVAKRLLEGERVTIVNAEEVLITGKKPSVLASYRAWFQTRNLANPRKGPFHYRRPDDLVRLTVRGMLPGHRERGRRAYRLLRVYVGVPPELQGRELARLPEAEAERLGRARFIKVGELSRLLGARF
jgi:large subunit ribosomal protein L13